MPFTGSPVAKAWIKPILALFTGSRKSLASGVWNGRWNCTKVNPVLHSRSGHHSLPCHYANTTVGWPCSAVIIDDVQFFSVLLLATVHWDAIRIPLAPQSPHQNLLTRRSRCLICWQAQEMPKGTESRHKDSQTTQWSKGLYKVLTLAQKSFRLFWWRQEEGHDQKNAPRFFKL